MTTDPLLLAACAVAILTYGGALGVAVGMVAIRQVRK